jgi:hypothetical protein
VRAIAPPAKRSIRHAAAHSDPPAPPLLRVDGFLLDGDKVAKAEKMRRYRDGNPEGVLRAQEKYWKT